MNAAGRLRPRISGVGAADTNEGSEPARAPTFKGAFEREAIESHMCATPSHRQPLTGPTGGLSVAYLRRYQPSCLCRSLRLRGHGCVVVVGATNHPPVCVLVPTRHQHRYRLHRRRST